MNDLLTRAQQGDAAAFTQLATAQEDLVWRVCYRLTGNQADAEDCVQETMLRAWRAIGSYRGDAAFSTWIYRIAVSCCMDAMRKKQARPAESLDSLTDAGFDPPARDAGPEETLERKDRREQVREALSTLPEEQRVPLVLWAMEGRSYEEIASLLDVPLGTVKSRISRAREKLAKMISPDGNFSAPDASNQVKGGQKHDL